MNRKHAFLFAAFAFAAPASANPVPGVRCQGALGWDSSLNPMPDQAKKSLFPAENGNRFAQRLSFESPHGYSGPCLTDARSFQSMYESAEEAGGLGESVRVLFTSSLLFVLRPAPDGGGSLLALSVPNVGYHQPVETAWRGYDISALGGSSRLFARFDHNEDAPEGRRLRAALYWWDR